MQRRPPFRVKPYRHDKYKFVVRAKLLGHWERRYFKTEAEAEAFAREQNAQFEASNGARTSEGNGAGELTNRGLSSSHQTETDSRPNITEETGRVAVSADGEVTEGETVADLNVRSPSDPARPGPLTDNRQVCEAQTKTLKGAIAEAYAGLAQLGSDLEAERTRSREDLKRVQEQANQSATAVEQTRAASVRLSSELDGMSLQRRELQAQAELDTQQIKALTAEVRNYRKQRDVLETETRALQSTIEEVRAESAQLAAKLGAERAGRSADRQRLKGLDQVLDELRRAKDALSKSQHRIEHLFTGLKIWRRNSTGLQRFQSILKGRLENVSRGLLQAGAALEQGEAERLSIIDAISEDIRQINHPSIGWKVARGLGLLRLARPGLPRTTADRKALASDLKAVLRAIRKTLSAKATPPEDAAIAMSRLFQLRRITRQFARSVDLRMLFLSQAPAWNRTQWTQPSAAKTPAAVLFDAPWYLAQYPDVAASGVDPLTHYLKWGAREGRNPNPVFDTDWYLVQNPHVAVAGLNPLEHYLQAGAREGRDPEPAF